ncbi:uncharacterized protein LOC142796083, partial [Rhipicephalus microplus]|uniref:uncharacterized protein LOC142796083 n=1 Tax=Rhipicephalus microplus TaxID=6941 RepID=UPI003F6BD5D3
MNVCWCLFLLITVAPSQENATNGTSKNPDIPPVPGCGDVNGQSPATNSSTSSTAVATSSTSNTPSTTTTTSTTTTQATTTTSSTSSTPPSTTTSSTTTTRGSRQVGKGKYGKCILMLRAVAFQ